MAGWLGGDLGAAFWFFALPSRQMEIVGWKYCTFVDAEEEGKGEAFGRSSSSSSLRVCCAVVCCGVLWCAALRCALVCCT